MDAMPSVPILLVKGGPALAGLEDRPWSWPSVGWLSRNVGSSIAHHGSLAFEAMGTSLFHTSCLQGTQTFRSSPFLLRGSRLLLPHRFAWARPWMLQEPLSLPRDSELEACLP